jgi:hypothetical protein
VPTESEAFTKFFEAIYRARQVAMKMTNESLGATDGGNNDIARLLESKNLRWDKLPTTWVEWRRYIGDELAYKYFKGASVQEFEARSRGDSLGAAVNDVAQNFNVGEKLDALKANTALYLDARNIKHLKPEQIDELFKFAFVNPEKVKLVIHNAEPGDEALDIFADLTNKEIVPGGGDINAAFRQFGNFGLNLQLSKEGVDPYKDSDTATREGMKFFRYRGDQVGLVAVALLYSELSKIQEKLAGIEVKGGYLYIVGEILQGLVRAYESQILVKRAA